MHIDDRIEEFLKHFSELSKLDNPDDNHDLLLINTSTWARRVFDYIVPCEGYNITEKIQIVDKKSGNARDEKISLMELLGRIIHSIHLNRYEHDNGTICLDITSDRQDVATIHFDDLIDAINKFNIPRLFRILIICNKLQTTINHPDNADTNRPDNADPIMRSIMRSVMLHVMSSDFSWLWSVINDNNEVKRKILSEFFGINNVADSTLRNIKFSSSVTTKQSIRIRRNLNSDIIQPNLFSEFPPQQILKLIKDEIKEQIKPTIDEDSNGENGNTSRFYHRPMVEYFAYDDSLQISEKDFKRELLKTKRAKVVLVYHNKPKEEKMWHADNFTQDSNVKGNLNTGYLRNWRQKGIKKILLYILSH